MAKNLSIPQEEGDAVEKAYFDAFKELKKFFDKQERDALDKGYILIDQKTGSKYFIAEFEQFKELHNKYKFSPENRSFWAKWKVEKAKKSVWWETEKIEMSRYFRWKSQIRRNAQNFPIQGSSASITKIAGIHFFRWLKSENLLNKVLISNIIHDEYLIECPKYIANNVANKLKEFMERAGSFYCKLVPLKAEPEITNFWYH